MRRDRAGRTLASKRPATDVGAKTVEPTPDPPPSAFDLLDPKALGDRLRFLHRAVVNGWEIRQEWMEEMPKLLDQISRNDKVSTRDRMKAMEIMRAMASDRVEATKSMHTIAKDLADRAAAANGQSTGVRFTFEVIQNAPSLGSSAGPATEVRQIVGP